MMKWFRRIFSGLLSVSVLLIVGLFALTSFIRYPDPVSAYQLATSVNSQQPDLMPSHKIPASANPHQWQVASEFEALPERISFEGSEYLTQQLLTDTATKAFLVVRDGQITYEWYAEDWSPERQMNTMSVGKTMLGIAAGIQIADGSLRESAPITEYLTEYAEVPRLGEVTVKHLLDMQSCIGIEDDYPSGPEGWLSPISQMFATTDMNHVLSSYLSVICEPGSEEYEYRSVNSQLLGMIVSRVSGESLADFFAKRVWQPLGTSYPASWSVDKVGGSEKAFCCFNAAARDLALIGQLFLNSGKVPFGENQGGQIMSGDWYARMTTPTKTWFGGYGSETFGANMWHKPNDQLVSQGYRGQFIWINRYTNTVVVKLSDDVENLHYDQVVAMLDQVSFTVPG